MFALIFFINFLDGVDIFGYEIIGSGAKLSGPFGDELIAGGFIQRFFIFFFCIPLFYPELRKKIFKIFIANIISIFSLLFYQEIECLNFFLFISFVDFNFSKTN